MFYLDESWIDKEEEMLKEMYLTLYEDYISRLPKYQMRKELVSGMNRLNRLDMWSCKELAIDAQPGDICFMDFGQVYINEAGYQHFGLVISKFNHKLFVVPMTSNQSMVKKSLVEEGTHLYHLGLIEGLNRPSVLFLNDCKYINSSRIISINAYICPESETFKNIEKRLKLTIFNEV